jgi:hypothetical protein
LQRANGWNQPKADEFFRHPDWKQAFSAFGMNELCADQFELLPCKFKSHLRRLEEIRSMGLTGKPPHLALASSALVWRIDDLK